MEAIEQAFRLAFPEWDRIDPAARAGMLAHAALLLEANRTTNLTALREPSRLVSELFEPSWRVGDLLDLRGKSVLDLGSGGGFPGIPLAVRFPTSRFVLADSVGKKADFLKGAVASIPAPNARVFSGRAEELLRRERFDCVLAQAVGATREILALLSPVRSAFGQLALMKGKSWIKECDEREASQLGFRMRSPALALPPGRPGDSRFLLLFQPIER